MAMNIKNPEAHRLAQQLATLTGTNITEAIILALREKLGRIESPQERLGDLREIAKDFAVLTKDVPRIDHAELLYDERGLPK